MYRNRRADAGRSDGRKISGRLPFGTDAGMCSESNSAGGIRPIHAGDLALHPVFISSQRADLHRLRRRADVPQKRESSLHEVGYMVGIPLDLGSHLQGE